MIVKPDRDAQLADPAFSPPGAVVVDALAKDYDAAASNRDLLVLAQPLVAAKSAAASAAVSAKIQAIDDEIAARAAADLIPKIVVPGEL